MYRIAVLGDRDSIYGFASLGLDIFPVESREEAADSFKKLLNGEYAVVYVTEAAAQQLEEEIDALRSQPWPAVIPIPGVSGNTGAGMRAVKKSVEQAVGSDILFNE